MTIKHGGGVTTKQKEYERKAKQNLGSVLLKSTRDPIRGFISDIRKDAKGDYYYEVRVRPDLTGSKNSAPTGGDNLFERKNVAGQAEITMADVWLPLGEDPTVIAQLYGDKDLILDSRCRVEFSSASPKTGIVFIEFNPLRRQTRKVATSLEKKAFLYATAGGGKLT